MHEHENKQHDGWRHNDIRHAVKHARRLGHQIIENVIYSVGDATDNGSHLLPLPMENIVEIGADTECG